MRYSKLPYVLRLAASSALGLLLLSTQPVALADAPGRNGSRTVTAANTVLNQYAVLAAVAGAGSGSITVVDVTVLSSPDAGGGALAAGDVVLLYQARGASINTTNTPTYGDITSYGDAGNYELRTVSSVAGNTIGLEPSLNGATCALGLRNTYAAGSQVIRVPQYSALTVNAGAGVVASAWNGSTGGVVAALVQGALAVNGSIAANGQGFRGGVRDGTDGASGGGVAISFASDADPSGGAKGEGIASGAGGTFGAVALAYSNPGGNFNIGAPANGGGGGGTHNGGGGGGANAALSLTPYCTTGTSTYSVAVTTAFVWCGQGAMPGGVTGAAAWNLDPGYKANGNALTAHAGGGRGGYGYSASNLNALVDGPGLTTWGGDNRRATGGWGGRPLQQAVGTRLFFGGGGGAGANNNNTGGNGGAGGGVVLIEAGSLSGSGSITANGANGASTTGGANDAPGGGGGGGSVILRAGSGSVGSLQASGGNGGLQTIANDEAEGPGGGGGGIVALTGASATQQSLAGTGGTTSSNSLTEFPRNGATDGSAGVTNQAAPLIRSTAGVCTNVSLRKDNAVTSVPAGGTTTYTLTVVNSGPGGAANTVLTDPAVAGLSCSTISCTGAAGSAVCPAGVSTTMAYLQGPGITLPTLPASSTLTFSLACSVPATGQ
ncbi:MAG: hypothetical protein Q7T87_16745 [Polaromonas sp.]|nr:hypothetical protein [Polaromonas sp.]